MGNNRRRAARIALLVLAPISLGSAMLSGPARGGSLFAPDGLAVNGGYTGNVAVCGVALNWNLSRDHTPLADRGFGVSLVAQLAYWQGRTRPTPNRFLWDASLTPMLRWTDRSASGPHYYAEAGIGINLLSATRINNDRIFSTAFQFGEQGGIGVIFGQDAKYELGVYAQHVSNANIKEPNDGITYPGIVFRAVLP